jgi:hypothetical protein
MQTPALIDAYGHPVRRSEVGVKPGSGVEILSGVFDYEHNQRLRGTKRWTTLDDMEADPEIKAGLLQVTLPILNADWSFKPATQEPRDIEIAHFCDAVILGKSNDDYGPEVWTRIPFRQRLFEELDFLRVGYSLFAEENPWTRVGDKVFPRRITWIEPETMQFSLPWEIDAVDDIVSITRTYRRADNTPASMETIPASRLRLYGWEFKGARYEGRAFLRSQFGAWFRKDLLQRAAIAWAQKVGAPPPVGFYPASYESQQDVLADFKTFIKSLRGTDWVNAYGVFPRGQDGETVEIKYAGSEANVERGFQSLIEGQNSEIARPAFRQSQQLGSKGSGGSGSRAVGQVQQAVEHVVTEAVAKTLITFEMQGAANLLGRVPELVARNFAGVTRCPELTVSGIKPDEQDLQAEKMRDGATAGFVPITPETRKAYCELIGLKLPDDAYADPEPPPQLAPFTGKPGTDPNAADGGGDAPVDDGGAPGGGTDPSMPDPAKPPARQPAKPAGQSSKPPIPPKQAAKAGMKPDPAMPGDGGRGAKPRGKFRAPTAFEERFVNLAQIDRETMAFEHRYYAVASSVLRKMEADVVDRTRSGDINAGNYMTLWKGDTGPDVKYRDDLQVAIEGVLRKAGAYGAEQVREEMAKQLGHRIGAAATPRVTFSSTIYETRAAIDVGSLVGRLESEIIGEYDRLFRQGLPPGEAALEMQKFLDSLSDRPIGDLARGSTTVAFNTGRATETTAMSDQIAYVVRTEILDGNTCDMCQSLDYSVSGVEYEVDSDLYYEDMPPAKCDGRDRCRGFYLVVASDNTKPDGEPQ